MTEAKDISILYIEDNEQNLQLMQNIIQQMTEYKLLIANTAESGIKIAKEFLLFFILMDINLPGMSGYDALELLKQDETTADIPVFALTAEAMLEQVKKSESSAFKKYLTKPINITTVLQLFQEEFELD